MKEADIFSILEDGNEDSYQDNFIPRKVYVKWIKHPDLNIQGAMYCFLTESRFSRLLDEPLTFEEFRDFLIHYFERCILEDTDSDWADTRYSAGWDIERWIGVWHSDRNISETQLEPFYKWLISFKQHPDEKVRQAIETTVFERVKIPE